MQVDEALLTLPGFLKDNGRNLYSVKGDGNCLFRVFSHQLTGCESNHILIRSILVRFENLNQTIFEKRLTETTAPTMNEHIRRLQRPSVWGSHVEIDGVAGYFQVPIYYCQKLVTGQYKWQVVKPLASAEKFKYPEIITDVNMF